MPSLRVKNHKGPWSVHTSHVTEQFSLCDSGTQLYTFLTHMLSIPWGHSLQEGIQPSAALIHVPFAVSAAMPGGRNKTQPQQLRNRGN